MAEMTTGTALALIGLLVNLMGIVWGAAKISASVTQLDKSTTRLSEQVEIMREDHSHLEGRVSVLEDRGRR